MIIRAQELLSRGGQVRLHGQLDLAERFRNIPDAEPLGPMEADLTASAEAGRIEVAGELSGRIRLSCSRCLSPVDSDYRVPYRESFQPVASEEKAVEEEGADFVPFAGDLLDIRPFLEEELLLHLPYAPLCSEDCRGLCPECGANLNERTCGCDRETIDPRLAVLKDWHKG
jgi:uncharacterized protein